MTETIWERWDVSPEENRRILGECRRILRAGGLVAFPTETVYGLGGDGLNPEASRKIYEAKGRPSDNPLILHISSEEELLPLVREIPEYAKKLMDAFWPGPMTMVFPKSPIVPKETTGGLDTVAIRMPSHPAAAAMIREAGVPVAAPSANRSGRPSPTEAAHVAEDLMGRIDLILDGGPVEIGLESTIIDVTGEVPVILRPGYLSREDIASLVGACEVDPAVLKKPDANLRPKAPGMKYRHYAPKAELTIFEGAAGAVAEEIRKRAAEALKDGKKTGILCAFEHEKLYEGFAVKDAGRMNSGEIAHNLYRCLREFDEEGADVIFSESFRQDSLGAAVMNRLTKAAGYHIIKV